MVNAVPSVSGCCDVTFEFGRPPWRRRMAAAVCALASLAGCILPAAALEIELIGAAADRIERQRAFERGALPLPGTPALDRLPERMTERGLALGDAVFLRVFKAESELEVWMAKDERLVRLATYPICHWSGDLGPKLIEGDRQTPEGFYTITRRQLHLSGRWPRSLNLGFPNDVDRALGRSGSYILIHGGCTSVGCFAMTNPVMTEVYAIVERALKQGQDRVHVHVFPFRMTDENLARTQDSPWFPFWQSLKPAYDQFEATHAVPRIAYCENRYVVSAVGPGEGPDPGPLAECGASATETPPQEIAANPSSRSPVPNRQNPAAINRSGAASPVSAAQSAPPTCNLARASCRKWSFLKSTSRQRSKVAEGRTRRVQ